jgi:hypothetical protein
MNNIIKCILEENQNNIYSLQEKISILELKKSNIEKMKNLLNNLSVNERIILYEILDKIKEDGNLESASLKL